MPSGLLFLDHAPPCGRDHLLCHSCLDLAEEAQDYVDAMRVGLLEVNGRWGAQAEQGVLATRRCIHRVALSDRPGVVSLRTGARSERAEPRLLA